MTNIKLNSKNLSDIQIDALQEIANIGTGSSAVALTQLLKRATYMTIPKVCMNRIAFLEQIKQSLIGISKTTSDLFYIVLVLIDYQSVSGIINLLTTSKAPIDPTSLSPLNKSLIQETGSIMTLKYVQALNYFLGANSFPSPISVHYKFKDKKLQAMLRTFDKSSEILSIECGIFTSHKSIKVELILLIQAETLEKLMNLLFVNKKR